MATRRHSTAIVRIRADSHRLTKRERAQLGLPDGPVRKTRHAPPFPSNPGELAWFALTTLPQREAEVAMGLARAGFAAFNPTETVEVRSNRNAKFRRRERQRALLTSMVLAGFPGRWQVRTIPGYRVPDGQGGYRSEPERQARKLVADVPWLRIRDIEGVTGFVGIGDAPVPVPVPLANVVALHMASGQRGATRNWSPSLGDPVEVAFGAFQGQAGRVVALSDGRARVALFGEGVLARLAAPLEVPETWVRQREPA